MHQKYFPGTASRQLLFTTEGAIESRYLQSLPHTHTHTSPDARLSSVKQELEVKRRPWGYFQFYACSHTGTNTQIVGE